jgi:hypothetical protein
MPLQVAFDHAKKNLSNEESAYSMQQHFLFPTAFAIIFALKPIAGI